jgi:predicted Zn-dependent protease
MFMNGLARKTLIFVVVMALVAASGWFGRKAYKRSMEHRLLTQANQYIEKKDWRNTALCLQRIFQINPMSAQASRLMAGALETASAPVALPWRIRTAKLEPGNVTNLLEWARTALEAKDLQSAAEALGEVSDQAKATAEYHKCAGALAWSRGDAADAERHYLEALRLEPMNQANVLNLATIRLGSTNQAVAAAARLSLRQTTTNATLRLTALRHLASDAIARKSLSNAVSYSMEIVRDPWSGFADQISCLELLRETGSSDYPARLALLKEAAARSPAEAFALGRWMAMTENPGAALRWLQALPPQIQTNAPVPLIITDCLITLKDWKGLFALVNKRDWGETEFYRLSVESLATRSLGQNVASENAWRKTLRLSAHRLDRLSRLAQVTSAWNWIPEKSELLRQITAEFPKEKWAVDQFMAQLYAEGNTRGLQELLFKVQSTDPSDPRLKNNLANVFLLRKSELDTAYRMAKEAFDTAPGDPFFISTYAYSLLLQNKREEALKVISGLKAEYLQIPSVAAYYGVIQAQSGHKDLARESLARAETAKLLPEEKEIVRLARARL